MPTSAHLLGGGLKPGAGGPPGLKPGGGKGAPGGANPPGGNEPGNPGGGARFQLDIWPLDIDQVGNSPPLPPGKPGAGGKPPNGGGMGPPTPAAGPYGESAFYTLQKTFRQGHTAREGAAAAPRPAARATPGPAARVDEMPPVVAFPSRALGSAGGGDSTEKVTICAPRTPFRLSG
jgi:hypothetical protein